MSCPCKSRTDAPQEAVKPDEPCVFCAEKHFATAWALSCELGYRSPNRARLLGELVLCAWHLYEKHPALAAKVRELRHAVELREEGRVSGSWKDLACELAELLESENHFEVEKVDESAEKKLRRALLLKQLLQEFADDPPRAATLRKLCADYRAGLPEEVLAKLPDYPELPGKIYLFSNVKGTKKLSIRKGDLLVFLNKAVPYSDYAAHRNTVIYHRTPEECYGAEVMGCVNRYVFSAGKASIPESFIAGLKKSYDWNYEIEPGKTKSATTGYMVAKYLQHLYPKKELILVNFGTVLNDTYHCPWHNWKFEAGQLSALPHVSTEEKE